MRTSTSRRFVHVEFSIFLSKLELCIGLLTESEWFILIFNFLKKIHASENFRGYIMYQGSGFWAKFWLENHLWNCFCQFEGTFIGLACQSIHINHKILKIDSVSCENMDFQTWEKNTNFRENWEKRAIYDDMHIDDSKSFEGLIICTSSNI